MQRVPLLILTLVLSFILLSSCGGGQAEEDLTEDMLNCQDACDKVMHCVPEASLVTAEMLEACRTGCVENGGGTSEQSPPITDQLIADYIDVQCHLRNQLCEEFVACRSLQREGEDALYPQWCRDWCNRCAACGDADPEFDDVACREATLEDKGECLDKCDTSYSGASEACMRLFDLFDPDVLSCEELASDNPFRAGC